MKKPKELNLIGKKKWDEIVDRYKQNSFVQDILFSLCQCYSRMIEAEKQMNKKGILYKNPSGKIEPSPMIGISNTMQNQIKKHYETLDRFKNVDVKKKKNKNDMREMSSQENDMGLIDIDDIDFYGL